MAKQNITKTELPFDQMDMFSGKVPEKEISALNDKFIVPPFSILDTRQGYWQERKRQWKALGIESEIGRDAKCYQIGDKSVWEQEKSSREYKVNEHLDPKSQRALGCYGAYGKTTVNRGQGSATGTSIFDPVLCELMYEWFCPKNGIILDPFAGGSVRGIVAAKTGRKYVGIDLSEKQLIENRRQANDILKSPPYPEWRDGDSINIQELSELSWCNFVFSCPPYHDLEIYSDDPRDLSNMSYEDFILKYRDIIKSTINLLRNNCFACFVVSEIRNKNGNYKGFVPDTIKAFEDAGLKFYNEIILINSIGSLPIRITKQFNSGKKIGRCHQNILVFKK